MNRVQFELLYTISGEFLCDFIPETWDDMPHRDKIIFVVKNACDDYSCLSGGKLLEVMEGCADVSYKYIMNAIKLQEEDR
jgi:hypothetical protein